jgi:hypothetical protein
MKPIDCSQVMLSPVGADERDGQTCVPKLQKTKDQGMLMSKTLSSHYFSDMIAQCDKARPSCRPCLKVKAACEYEFPAVQARNQALSENQRRLQGQLRTFTLLVYTLRCADANTSGRILSHLRHGDYDGTLLCDNSNSYMTQDPDKVYPWEDLPSEEQPQPGSRNIVLPPVGDLRSIRRTSAEHSISHMIHQTPSPSKQHHREYSLPSQIIAMPSVSPSEFGPLLGPR